MSNKAGRNDACPCGSKKKFKNCCGGAKQKSNRGNVFLTALVVALVAGGLIVAVVGYTSEGSSQAAPGKVWSPEHGHYH
jgi:hypothetical protein